jgi:hypothetical protein
MIVGFVDGSEFVVNSNIVSTIVGKKEGGMTEGIVVGTVVGKKDG